MCESTDLLHNIVGVDFAFHVDESAFAQAAEPRALAFGEAAGAVGDAGDHFLVVEFAGEIGERFAIADGLARGAAES